MENQNEPDMLLPEGFTCAECWLFKKCESFGVTQGKNTLCDFSPSKFMLDPEKYLALRSLIKELVEDGERLEKEAISEWHAPEVALSFECEFCESGFFESREAVKHSDNCPLNQHLALMQKVKEVFPITEEKRDASAPTGLSKEALSRIAEGTSGNLDHLGGINGG